MKQLLLFDVDGTLCQSGQKITIPLINILEQLKDKYTLAIVGGGDYDKIKYQLDITYQYFTYIFSENGVISYKNNIKIYENNIRDKIGIDNITKINNILLKISYKLDIPYKTGKFIILRKGLIYFTPIGQDCTTNERQHFIKLDKQYNIRLNIIKQLEIELNDVDVEIVLGGELGIAIYPRDWSKKLCLSLLDDNYIIYYFGDQICLYGNDYMIAIDENVHKYYYVNSISDTIQILSNFISAQ